MNIKQVTSIYKVEENGDLSYRRSLDGWDKKGVLAFDAAFINELEIGDEVYSIDETYNLIVEKLDEIHALVGLSGIDNEIYKELSAKLIEIKIAVREEG